MDKMAKKGKQEFIKLMNELSPPSVQERKFYIEQNEMDNNERLNNDIISDEVIRAINCCKKIPHQVQTELSMKC